MKTETEQVNSGSVIRWLIVIGVIIVGLIIAASSIVQVPAGFVGVLKVWGAAQDTPLEQGLHFVTPLISEVVPIDIKTQKYEIVASAATSDLMDVSTKAAVNYHISVPQSVSLFRNIGLGFQDTMIAPLIQTEVKANTIKYNALELVKQRPLIENAIEETLRAKLAPIGIVIERVSITNYDYPPAFNDAITSAQTAVQKAIEANNTLARIQYEAQQKVAAAQGEANATLAKAIAEAQSLEIRGKAIRENPEVVQLNWITAWDGHLPTYYFPGGNGALPILQIPTGSASP
jgi:prohibitin 2